MKLSLPLAFALSLATGCASNSMAVSDDALAGDTSPAISSAAESLKLAETEVEKVTTAKSQSDVTLLKAKQEYEGADERRDQNGELIEQAEAKKDTKAVEKAKAVIPALEAIVEAKRAQVELRSRENKLATKNLELAVARRDLAHARLEEARADLAITKHNDDATGLDLAKFKAQTANQAKKTADIEGDIVELVEDVSEAEKEYSEALSKSPQVHPNVGG